ncbi:MAG: hypothetical protein A2516_11010 [Alphaproteobacteria bacterium RIFOXYD12_FULL_60_8]|nr:MAG: hypothetical protein A2516_11010 [Alphaproteobacteria bacterium RIFOXYD12_FULL_60_8]
MASTFFAGYQITASSRKLDHAALPMVDLLSGEEDLVLDGGCGAGRTSLALAPVLKRGKIVALDRFDSDYIEGGGHALLERNARLAGFSDRIQAKMGDLTQLPFPEATFDAAVSAHAMDHLGDAKEAGFREMLRVLKPGRRFLFIAWTPSWSMFAIANVLSFFLTTKAAWRILAARVGFSIVQEGCFNGFWYLLLQKPSEVGAPNA